MVVDRFSIESSFSNGIIIRLHNNGKFDWTRVYMLIENGRASTQTETYYNETTDSVFVREFAGRKERRLQPL